MSNVPYIEHDDENGNIVLEMYKDGYVGKFKYTITEPHCPRCLDNKFINVNGTATCQICNHQWPQPQPPADPGTITQLDINTGEEP